MVRRSLLKRIATLLAFTLLLAQLAIASHACARSVAVPSPAAQAANSDGHDALADAKHPCHEATGAKDPASPNLCAEHCKQGQQSDRASLTVEVLPALLNALYDLPSSSELPRQRPSTASWLSALVAASPPHAIAHCVLRI